MCSYSKDGTYKIKFHEMGVKSNFLNGVLKEEAYVEQPLGFETPRLWKRVYKLKKAFNGLKQTPNVSVIALNPTC